MTAEHARDLRSLHHAYDFFIVDQWACMHDGWRALAGVPEALEHLVSSGKQVLTLSNSSRSRAATRANLALLGYESGRHYHHIVTSGTDFQDALRDKTDGFYRRLGHRFFLLRYVEDRSLVAELPELQEVSDLSQADWIMCAGMRPGSTLEAYASFLQTCLERALPMVCANPDLHSLDRFGQLQPCAGALAQRYEAMGGQVRWHGKPRPETYHACFRLLGVSAEQAAGRGLGIGDSLLHDIKGAAGVGLDTLFITQGIHRDEFNDDPETQRRLFERYGVTPTYHAERLVW